MSTRDTTLSRVLSSRSSKVDAQTGTHQSTGQHRRTAVRALEASAELVEITHNGTQYVLAYVSQRRQQRHGAHAHNESCWIGTPSWALIRFSGAPPMCFSHVQMKPGFANKSAVSAFILAPSACVLRPKLAGGTSPHMWMMSR